MRVCNTTPFSDIVKLAVPFAVSHYIMLVGEDEVILLLERFTFPFHHAKDKQTKSKYETRATSTKLRFP